MSKRKLTKERRDEIRDFYRMIDAEDSERIAVSVGSVRAALDDLDAADEEIDRLKLERISRNDATARLIAEIERLRAALLDIEAMLDDAEASVQDVIDGISETTNKALNNEGTDA